MSYYYNYYAGQRNKETGKFTTVAPYDADGSQCVCSGNQDHTHLIFMKTLRLFLARKWKTN